MANRWDNYGIGGDRNRSEDVIADPNPAEPRAPAYTPAERRENLAGLAMQGLLSRALSNPPAETERHNDLNEVVTYADIVARDAVLHADALIRALLKPATPYKEPRT
jgi:hypothetical protein